MIKCWLPSLTGSVCGSSRKRPSTFGIQKSSISRKFIQTSAKHLKAFTNWDLGMHDIPVIFMDGKTFSENEMTIDLGVSLSGQKIVLGMRKFSGIPKKYFGLFLKECESRFNLNATKEQLNDLKKLLKGFY